MDHDPPTDPGSPVPTPSSQKFYHNRWFQALVVLLLGCLAAWGVVRYYQQSEPQPEPVAEQAPPPAPEPPPEPAAPPAPPPLKTHMVAVGDTLWSIADKEYDDGLCWVGIASQNQITNPRALQPGTELKLPASCNDAKKVTASDPEPLKTHTVTTGDTLSQIADNEYGDMTCWTGIAQASEIKNPGRLIVGQALVIPAECTKVPSLVVVSTTHRTTTSATASTPFTSTYTSMVVYTLPPYAYPVLQYQQPEYTGRNYWQSVVDWSATR